MVLPCVLPLDGVIDVHLWRIASLLDRNTSVSTLGRCNKARMRH